MYKSILIYSAIFALSILFSGCGSDSTSPDNPKPAPEADQYRSFSDLMGDLRTEADTLTITDPTKRDTIEASGGTKIIVGPGAFTDQNDDLYTGKVIATLHEYLSLEDMILNNVQTTSNHKLLVTGGNFNLTFQDDNGDALNTAASKLHAEMPVKTDITGYENDMDYFTGERITQDGREMVNWELRSDTLASITNGTFNTSGIEDSLSNCDAFLSISQNDATQFEVSVPGISDYSKDIIIWVIVKDFPSVAALTKLTDDEDGLKTFDETIPKGLNATLLAIATDKDGYLQFGSSSVTVSGDDKFSVPIDYGTTDELQSLISTITN